MADVKTTLKNESGTNNIYPNILADNIPDSSITTGKLAFHLYKHNVHVDIDVTINNTPFTGGTEVIVLSTSTDTPSLATVKASISTNSDYMSSLGGYLSSDSGTTKYYLNCGYYNSNTDSLDAIVYQLETDGTIQADFGLVEGITMSIAETEYIQIF